MEPKESNQCLNSWYEILWALNGKQAWLLNTLVITLILDFEKKKDFNKEKGSYKGTVIILVHR
jgi:hypothetical protein